MFEKEAKTLELAREALAGVCGMDKQADAVFRDLVKAYARLLKQSRRIMSMGDRMQQSLNELNREIAASESKYRGVFENVNEGIFRCAPDGSFIEVNPAMAAMFGYADSDAFLCSVLNVKELFCSSDDFERYKTLLASDGVHRHEVQAYGPEGQTIWAEVSASVIRESDAEAVSGVVGVLADVTERKQMLEDICRLARTDSLTGLWNRGYFMELAGRELARCHRSGAPLSLLIVDVDYFKAVNDTYGHDVGDRALVDLARVLREAVREIDLVGRHGGEEFAVLLPDANRAEAEGVAERMADAVRSNVLTCDNQRIPLTVSIGLTSLRPKDDLDGLLKFADIALYAAKKNGRDRVEVYQRQAREAGLRAVQSASVAASGGEQ